MSPSTFTLVLPAAAPFPALASEVAARFLELCGATADEAARFSAELTQAAERIVPGADRLDCTFVGGPSGVEATLTAGAHRQTVRHRRS
jgi:hypothetical protein